MKCIYCKNEIQEGEQYCPFCGGDQGGNVESGATIPVFYQEDDIYGQEAAATQILGPEMEYRGYEAQEEGQEWQQEQWEEQREGRQEEQWEERQAEQWEGRQTEQREERQAEQWEGRQNEQREERQNERREGRQDDPQKKSPNGLLRFFTILCIVIYGIKAVTLIPMIFLALFQLAYAPPIGIVSLLFNGMDLLLCLLTIFLLLHLGKARDQREEELLYLGLICGTGIRVIANAVFALISQLLQASSYQLSTLLASWLLTVLGAALLLGGIYGLLLVAGEKPFQGKSISDIQGMLADLVQLLQEKANHPSDKTSGSEKKDSFSADYIPGDVDTSKSLLKYILFSILTCGIYSFFFYYAMARDINKVCDGDGEKTAGLLAYIGFGILTCGIYTFFWNYKFADRLLDNSRRFGVTVNETGTTVLLWDILGLWICGIGPFVALYIQIKNLNKLAKAYNEQKKAAYFGKTQG